MEKKENLIQIASSISSHNSMENRKGIRNKAFARALCKIEQGDKTRDGVFWLTNREGSIMYEHRDFTGTGIASAQVIRTSLEQDGQPVYKNTKFGEVLTKYASGEHTYTSRNHLKRIVENFVTIYNRATYTPMGNDPVEVEIRMDDEKLYRFQKLSELISLFQKHEEEMRKKKEEIERIERELAEQKAREERERLEEERKKRQEEIDRIEQQKRDTQDQIKMLQSFMRKNIALRSQHLLDEYQEDAKRSHIFDGVPIVIEGGPGTGKTTTMIQRLKFLLSDISLKEYEAPLSDAQREYLTSPSEVNNRWLFFSPTDLLLRYLQANMREEGLQANDTNTRTIQKFRAKIMRDYQLFNPSKEGPFKDFKPHKSEELLISDASKVIRDFEQFIIATWAKTFANRAAMDTAGYEWRIAAESIKRQCERGVSIKDIEALMRLFNSLQDNEKANVKEWKDKLHNILNHTAMSLQQRIMKDEKLVEVIKELFDRWRKERTAVEEMDDEDATVENEDDEEENSFSKQEFESQLFSQLKKLIRQLGLRNIDSKIKISKRNRELLSIVEPCIEDKTGIVDVGKIAWFVRNFASLCRGTESNLLGAIPKLYKAFRKTQLEGCTYKTALLKSIIEKDSNKHLHPDEQNLLIGFINEMLYSIFKKSCVRFDGMKHKYVQAYKMSVRPVIGIDEATDYGLLDYYFMVSFRHYEFSSITLCGDLMQGLNSHGIRDWKDLKSFLPKMEVKTLNISYRQLPTLLNLARELYREDRGAYPSYYSDKTQDEKEPKPLLLISDDEDEKIRWISERILNIMDCYNELPSIAIFVGDNVDIHDFIEKITDMDILNGIEVVDCSGDKQLQNKEQVRVFRLSEIKGMEFEATFFYDIDDAINNKDESLMRRYLYVGISRATSHLAATMREDADYGIISYFETEENNW